MVCKVEPGTSADYVIEEQAEYHLGGREPNGHWYASDQFGLADGAEIDNRLFRALHAGEDPVTGQQIGKPNASGERVCGYDAQFAAPKSVSVLWALADTDTRAKIEVCQERAVRAALDFAQQAGAQIRTGHNGVNLEKTAFFGATFQHGESRPTERDDGEFRSDPQLHTHSIIFNLGLGADGQWRALDGRTLMALQKAMGAQYHAELANLLETELGAVIERHDLPDVRHNGEFEIRGVAPDLLDRFSTRRQQITEAMATHGLETHEAAELADAVALSTRKGKTSETRDQQLERWTTEAAEDGHIWQQIRALALGRQLDQVSERRRAKEYGEALAAVAERLTENESTFSQVDLYAAIAAAGAGRGHGAIDVVAIEADMLARGDIVALATDEKGQAIYSTAEMIQVEREIQQWAAEQAAAYPVVNKEPSDAKATRPRPINDNFGFTAPENELDAVQLASGTEAGRDGLHNLSRQPMGRLAAGGSLLLSDQARCDVAVFRAAAAHTVRRSDARRLGAGPHTVGAAEIDAYLSAREASGRALTDEQGISLHWIGRHGGHHVVIEGAAGSGKTVSVMQGAADLYHAKGYRVLATAQRWVTTLDLAKVQTPNGKHIEGRAAAKWIADYKAGRATFDARTVILVDEAGQMGSREAHALMQIAEKTGCRIIWTGDQKQQKSAAAGDPLALLAKELGSFRLAESQRMKATAADVIAWRQHVDQAEAHRRAAALSIDDRASLIKQHGTAVEAAGAVWARKAADAFAHGRAAEALAMFREHDQLVWADSHDSALDAAVAGWAVFKGANPHASAVVSAGRHVDVRALNDRMRQYLRSIGQIEADQVTVPAIAPNGEKFGLALAIGDQVRLGANVKDLDAFNGMVGIVRKISNGEAGPHLELDMHTPKGVRRIDLDTTRLVDKAGRIRLAHGYAGTNTLIQGATVDATFGQVSSRDSSNSAYVIASRARHVTILYLSRERENASLVRRLPLSERRSAVFTDEDRERNLAAALSRSQTKKSTLTAGPTQSADAVNAAATSLAAVRTQAQQQQENEMGRKAQAVQTANRDGERRSKQIAEAAAVAAPPIDQTAELGEEYGIDASADKRRFDHLKQLGEWYKTNFAAKHEEQLDWIRFEPNQKGHDQVAVGLRDGSRIRDNGNGRILLEGGRGTPQRAELMIEIAAAQGLTALRLRGSRDFKRDLAKAAFEHGLEVKNPELQPYMQGLERTMPHRKGIHAQAVQEREVKAAEQVKSAGQNPAASDAARRQLAADREDRQMATVEPAQEQRASSEAAAPTHDHDVEDEQEA